MSSTPREIGTLIVVVLRANHLPNKRHIGKQDPYCLVVVNGEKRRTKAIKRGGQHPEWDEEIRFTLYEDTDDVLARTARGDDTPPPPPPKDSTKKTLKVKGGKTMKVACYADDPREPDLIGECEVDLTEVLTKGETDEWFQLSNKEKFAGRVYLELTFWSNEPPPEKKAARKVVKNNTQYGGPGSFVPSGDPRAAGSGEFDHTRQSSDIIPSSLRTSNSGANLYVAPYERGPNVDQLAQEFSDFGMYGARRRESVPPVHGHYPPNSQYSAQSSFTNGSQPYGHEQTLHLGPPQSYSYDRPLSPNDPAARFSQSNFSTLNGHPGYQAQPYDSASQISHHPVARGPRHSVPTASSGFMPLSGHGSLPSHVSEPSGFHPPPSHTPAPAAYQSQFLPQPQQAYPPLVSQTPAPPVNNMYLPQSTSLSFQPQQQQSPQQYAYNYIPPSTSAPQQQYVPPPASQSPLHIQQPNTIPPQSYTPNLTSPPEFLPPASPQHLAPQAGQSRPLPQQPQVVYTQPSIQPGQVITASHSLPPSGSLPQVPTYAPATPAPNVYQTTPVYSPIPPPPPPPPIQYATGVIPAQNTTLPVPPPPPPPLAPSPNPQRRRASLPQPPVSYAPQNVQAVFQQVPPPPPPPPPSLEQFNRSPLPPPPPPLDYGTAPSNGYAHHDLPKPPSQVDEHGQWVQPSNVY